MTEDLFLDRLAVEEGIVYAEPPAIDQPTGPYGITLPALEADRGRPCTVGDLKALAAADAREVARRKIRRDIASAGLQHIAFEPLRYQVLDYGYESGMALAIRWLQRTAGLTAPFITGQVDARTIASLNQLPTSIVNNALAGGRAHAAYHGGTQSKFAAGVAHRAIEFVVPLDEPAGT